MTKVKLVLTKLAVFACLCTFSFFNNGTVEGQITTPERHVQISSIDFTTSVLELTNFGPAAQALDGWRFCSHDEEEIRRYSNSIIGITLEPGQSLFVHFNDDATGPDAINSSSIGGAFARPLDQFPMGSGAFAIAIYFESNFSNGGSIADHLQWSYDGIDSSFASHRSDEAEEGGVWVDQTSWIVVDDQTTMITLNANVTGSENHGPADYQVIDSVVEVDIIPESLSVFRGIVVAGGFPETAESDDSYFDLNPGFTLNSSESPVAIIFDAALANAPSGLAVNLEARANTAGLTQTVEAFNWMTNSYDEVAANPASFNTDSMVSAELAPVSSYVEAGTNNVRTRTSWRATGFVLLFPWQVGIDQVFWTTE